MYTWGPSNLDGNGMINKGKGKFRLDYSCGIESLHNREQPRRKDTNCSNKMVDFNVETVS